MSASWAKANPERWREYKRQWQTQNSEKAKAYRKKWNDANPEKRRAAARKNYWVDPEKHRTYDRRKRHKIEPSDFLVMMTAQDGKCAGCQTLLTPGRGTHVDHNHATGKIRGLLCRGCNHALGNVADSPEVLEALAAYLRADALAGGAHV